MTIRPIEESDRKKVRDLLEKEKLPVDILDGRKGEIWVMEQDGEVVGSGAFEFYDTDALLRSVVVTDSTKGKGTGTKMVDFLEQEAHTRGVHTIWLLTETAEGFFARRGYENVERSVIVNKGILDSAEFKHLCASTAVCMKKTLRRAE